MIPKVLKGFNLFIDTVGYAGVVEEVNLPKLDLKMDEIYNGGMDAPIDVEMGMSKLECDFTLSEYTPAVITAFGLRTTATSQGGGAQIPLTMRGALDGEQNAYVPVVVSVTGALKDLDMGGFKSGERAPLKCSMTLRYYKLTIDGADLVEIEVGNMVRKINGVDQLESMRSALNWS